MKARTLPPRRAGSPLQPGFALIATLSMMILLTLIAVGLLSLSTVTVRSGAAEADLAVARANARLAMIQALGELQTYAGADQRVTATADILEQPNATGNIAAPVQNPHWTGVWRTDRLRAETSTTATTPVIYRDTSGNSGDPTYQTLKDRRNGSGYNRASEALTWLVSNPTPGTPLDPTVAYSGDTVEILGTGSVGSSNSTDIVKAPKVPVMDGTVRTGSYAWWVSDEGTKAKFNLHRAPSGATALAPASLNPAQAGLGVLPNYSNYKTLADKTLDGVVSRENAELTGIGTGPAFDDLKKHYHDLTFYSRGLATDSLNGGLKRDLSAFLATGNLAAVGSSALYPAINASTPLINTPNLSLISPKFGLLKSWSDLSTKISGHSIAPIPPVNVANAVKIYYHKKNNPLQESGPSIADQSVAPVHPVMVEASISYGVSLKKGTPAGTGKSNYTFRLHYYPRIVLWNPYSVELSAKDYAIQVAMPATVNLILDGQNKRCMVDWDPNIWGVLRPGSGIDPFKPVMKISGASFKPGEALLFTADASSAPDQSLPWTAASTSLNSLPLSCTRPLQPKADSFMMETSDIVGENDRTAQTMQLDDSLVSSGNYKYRITILPDSSDFRKHYWAKLWLLKAGSSFDTTTKGVRDADMLQFWQQTENGASGSDSPSFSAIDLSPAVDTSYPTRKPYGHFKWGNRLQWFDETLDNRTVYGYPRYLEQNLFASHNIRANWLVRSPIENAFTIRSTGSGVNGGLSNQGISMDDFVGFDWDSYMPTSVNGRNRVSPFGGTALTYPLLSLPETSTPQLSLGAFQHAPLSPFVWEPTNAFGNSWANQRVKRNATVNVIQPSAWDQLGQHPGSRSTLEERQAHINAALDSTNQAFLYDLSYESNFALWDRYFLSTVTQSHTAGKPLANSRMIADDSTTSAVNDLKNGNRAASRLFIDGAFNVNSTRESAWAALLATFAGHPDMDVLLADGTTTRASNVYSRLLAPVDKTTYGGETPADQKTWSGFRALTDTQINELAKQIVLEVKRRGPFVSLSDFINRRLYDGPSGTGPETPGSKTELGLKGALQAAIDRTTLNQTLTAAYPIAKAEYAPNNAWGSPNFDNFATIPGQWGYGAKPDHRHYVDSKAVGVPNYLTQADVLQKLGSVISARSDTFVIRTYGESLDKNGHVKARAWAECVVQRTATPINPDSTFSLNPVSVAGSGTDFGRRLEIISFRWLDSKEI